MWLISFVIFFSVLNLGKGESEHKVHNIILYPEKHSWCQTTPIEQVVAWPGYDPVTIDNNVCVGACYSYTIPRTQPAEPGELIGPYCDSCQPIETKCYHVTLKRTDSVNTNSNSNNNNNSNNNGEQLPATVDSNQYTLTYKKRVQIITRCSCTPCEYIFKPNMTRPFVDDCASYVNGNEPTTTLELPANLFTNNKQAAQGTSPSNGSNSIQQPNQLDGATTSTTNTTTTTTTTQRDVPELMHIMTESVTSQLSPLSQLSQLSTKLMKKVISSSGTKKSDERIYSLDSALIKSLKSVQESSGKVPYNDKNDIVKMLQAAGVGDKLTDRDLVEFVNYVNAHSDVVELDVSRLREILTLTDESGDKFEQISNSDDSHKFDTPGGVTDSATLSTVIPTFKNINNIDDVGKDAVGDLHHSKLSNHAHHHHQHHHHHHKLGDEVQDGAVGGRLVVGPHGSMVMEPVEVKLNIDSDVLKPNHDGAVIAYENHRKREV